MANTYTPGLKLRQPAQGDDYWDDDINANFDILEAALGRGSGVSGVIGSGLAVSDGGGLWASYTGGTCRVDGTKFDVGAGSVALVDNMLNFVWVNASGNVLAAAGGLPSPPYAALALVETAGGAIVRIGDLRRPIVDVLAEHDEDGKHGVIQPQRIEPSGTGGAYRRSSTASYKDPEERVNNIILKNDTTPLIGISGKDETFEVEYTAANLGSGYVPSDANALIVCARPSDWTAGQRSVWIFYPSDALADDDVRYAAVAHAPNIPGDYGRYFYYQLMFRLSSEGKFKLKCQHAPVASADIRVRLVGWIEPA